MCVCVCVWVCVYIYICVLYVSDIGPGFEILSTEIVFTVHLSNMICIKQRKVTYKSDTVFTWEMQYFIKKGKY
jgi:hypothetical protein